MDLRSVTFTYAHTPFYFGFSAQLTHCMYHCVGIGGARGKMPVLLLNAILSLLYRRPRGPVREVWAQMADVPASKQALIPSPTQRPGALTRRDGGDGSSGQAAGVSRRYD